MPILNFENLGGSSWTRMPYLDRLVGMKPRVYLETTIISYLTARPSRTVLGAAHQQVTIDWWETRRDEFDLVVSELVLREAEAGDPAAAQKRLSVLGSIPRLALTEEALELSNAFVAENILPQKAAEDGLHIAIATVHRVDNCSHGTVST